MKKKPTDSYTRPIGQLEKEYELERAVIASAVRFNIFEWQTVPCLMETVRRYKKFKGLK